MSPTRSAPRPVSLTRPLVRPLAPRLLPGALAFAAAALVWAPSGLAAQQDTVALDEIERRVELMTPVSGPPGTTVRLASQEMPSITPIRVGLGAVRAGFESLLDVLTSMDGAFDVTVQVPEWAQWDRVHRFVVFDIYFRPIALSELFHVTDENGLVHREGRVLGEAGACAWLRDVDGIEYGLAGQDLGAMRDRSVAVDARVRNTGSCGRPFTLEVVAVETR